jgi:transposase
MESVIVEKIKKGESTKEIAEELNVTVQDISQHIVRIYGKLGVATEDSDRLEKMMFYLRVYGYSIENNSGGRLLTEEQSARIKKLAEEVSAGDLTQRFGVSLSTINRAINRPENLGEEIILQLKKIAKKINTSNQ